ncbi:hypothetical protein ABTY23_21045, partial [Streptomyces sp. NPDC096068]
ARSDAARTAPPFRLQGSYRTMNTPQPSDAAGPGAPLPAVPAPGSPRTSAAAQTAGAHGAGPYASGPYAADPSAPGPHATGPYTTGPYTTGVFASGVFDELPGPSAPPSPCSAARRRSTRTAGTRSRCASASPRSCAP